MNVELSEVIANMKEDLLREIGQNAHKIGDLDITVKDTNLKLERLITIEELRQKEIQASQPPSIGKRATQTGFIATLVYSLMEIIKALVSKIG